MVAAGLIVSVVTFQAKPLWELGLSDSQPKFLSWKKQFSAPRRHIEQLPINDGRYWIGFEDQGSGAYVNVVQVVREIPYDEGTGKTKYSYWTCCTFNRTTFEPLRVKLSPVREYLIFYTERSKRVIVSFATR